MLQYDISPDEFNLFRRFIYEDAGINLGNEKKALVLSRLSKRLRHYSLSSFSEYYELMLDIKMEYERQIAVDLLTTHETYFFRERKHFEFIEKVLLPSWNKRKTLRVWSAASSTGEEAYSLAMLLQDKLKDYAWSILGSDISEKALSVARNAHYKLDRLENLPKHYLKEYCLKGIGDYAGTFRVDQALREKVEFVNVNLNKPFQLSEKYDFVFLRNVLIYFDQKTKSKIVSRVIQQMNPGGHLFIGHSETLKGVSDKLENIEPSICMVQ